jgi:hypothetical protein
MSWTHGSQQAPVFEVGPQLLRYMLGVCGEVVVYFLGLRMPTTRLATAGWQGGNWIAAAGNVVPYSRQADASSRARSKHVWRGLPVAVRRASHALGASRVVMTVVTSFGRGDAGEGVYRREHGCDVRATCRLNPFRHAVIRRIEAPRLLIGLPPPDVASAALSQIVGGANLDHRGVTITQQPCDDVPYFTQKGITGWQE